MKTGDSTPANGTIQTTLTPAIAKVRNPWLWIPSLYFAQGIPYVVVMTLSVIMYKRLGISNTDISLYTSLLYLPWVLKPLWSPLVDIIKTKRQWILAMQMTVAATLAAAGLAVQSGLFFILSLAVFWVMAFSSSTHDIAADGFYMLGLSKHEQAWWVGIRSTCYRLAMIVGSGLLIMLAGVLESKNGLPPCELEIHASPNATAAPTHNPAAITLTPQEGPLRLITIPESLTISTAAASKTEIEAVLAMAANWNRAHGYTEIKTSLPKTHTPSLWTQFISDPSEQFLRKYFPKKVAAKNPTGGNVGVVFFALSKPPTQNVVVSCSAKPTGLARFGIGSADKGFKLIAGERIVFTPENWNQPFMAPVQLDPKLSEEASVTFVTRSGNIPLAWSITLVVLAVVFLAFCLWHGFVLPKPTTDGPVTSGRNLMAEFLATWSSFFKKPGILLALTFILFYRFAEAQSVKLLTPFLLDAREAGGLGLTTGQVGFTYGTVGILSLTFGGLFGGFLAARRGLKAMLPVMVCAIHLPNMAFVYMSFAQPENFLLINACVAVEQFGYGFGFTAYMLYMLYFADGEHKTAHYAICTGFMALGMMLPGFFSGWLQEIIGYQQFFLWVMLATIPGFCVAFLIKIDPQFGRKTAIQ